MPRRYLSLKSCLFDAFANEGTYCNPQDSQYMWAIHEGVARLEDRYWASPTARKKHDCIRGCEIKPGQTYFKYKVGGGWGDDWKFCAGCMAMILYFKDVQNLPAQFATHWDLDAGRTVRLKETEF